jgi:hypothetical protein
MHLTRPRRPVQLTTIVHPKRTVVDRTLAPLYISSIPFLFRATRSVREPTAGERAEEMGRRRHGPLRRCAGVEQLLGRAQPMCALTERGPAVVLLPAARPLQDAVTTTGPSTPTAAQFFLYVNGVELPQRRPLEQRRPQQA